MKKLNDGYPDPGFGYRNKGHSRTDGWKWTAIISLSLSVLLAVSFVLYVVLHSSTPVDTTPQGEYWRTHENTRLGDDVIDEWLNEYLGGDPEHAGDEIYFDEESISVMLGGILEKVYLLDDESWMYLLDENTLDFVQYEFEPVIDRFPDSQNEIYSNYGLEEGRLPKNSSLYSLLVGAGLSIIAADVFIGSYYTIKGAGIAATVFPPAAPASSLIIAGALALLTIIILDNWSSIVKITADLIRFFTDVVPGFLAGQIRDFFNWAFGDAKKHVEQRYDNRLYTKVTLDRDFVAKEASKQANKNAIYLVLGSTKPNAGGQIMLGILVGTATGGIDEKYAVTIMRRKPGAPYMTSNVGGMVVSIYTYFDQTAKKIATEAGNGVPAHFDPAGRIGWFDHYHNGELYALYPKQGKDNSLPHAFWGYPR